MADRVVTLNHGAGGETMRRFITKLFVEKFANPALNTLADAALIEIEKSRLAFTTDSYIVKPIEFPGGDIGKLAVCGTVNDLAVMGARPLHLSVGFIIEEGFDLSMLERIVHSMSEATRAANVEIVTGDTKVVPRGECDGLFINTSGVGACPLGKGLSSAPIGEGDAILVSGTIGEHGMAILTAREGLKFQTRIESDCAALGGLIESVLNECDGVKWMRDATRGGLAAVLSELVESQPFGALIEEQAVPVRDDVRTVCELLGFDPMHLANEGKVVMVVRGDQRQRALEVLHANDLGRQAVLIGRITGDGKGIVRVRTEVGGIRRLQRPAGELLPRIC
ncbi:hydrogenase expression/formation protein HypE [bacterium]|nr:hydrogenase expression/formation protein HypE [bacterium]MBU1983991.1 hydrogenase expression/formation protein HypE [bacterium]